MLLIVFNHLYWFINERNAAHKKPHFFYNDGTQQEKHEQQTIRAIGHLKIYAKGTEKSVFG